MNEQDEEYETMKLGAEVIKERIDKVDELEKRIARIEARLHSNDLKIGRVVKSMCIMVDMMITLRTTLPDEEDVIEDILASLEDAGDDIVHEDWW